MSSSTPTRSRGRRHRRAASSSPQRPLTSGVAVTRAASSSPQRRPLGDSGALHRQVAFLSRKVEALRTELELKVRGVCVRVYAIVPVCVCVCVCVCVHVCV